MVAVPGQVVYAGTKFAVVGLSTAMADEFAPQGVEVIGHPADVHQHRADRGHQEHRRAEAGPARGHRRGDRQDARQAQDARVGACAAAVRRRRHVDARPARQALAVQADGQRPRLPRLRQDRAPGATRTGRRPPAASSSRSYPPARWASISGSRANSSSTVSTTSSSSPLEPTRIDVRLLGVAQPDPRHRLDRLVVGAAPSADGG